MRLTSRRAVEAELRRQHAVLLAENVELLARAERAEAEADRHYRRAGELAAQNAELLAELHDVEVMRADDYRPQHERGVTFVPRQVARWEVVQ